jgi:ADP-ribosylglycohydrolase
MPVPQDYTERVYAGVLGKIIGVYLGRPFEGWRYDRIMEQLGEVKYYVHEQLGAPLIVTDDDISGTFTFLRALPDYDNDPKLTPAQIGQTWLNYIIENRTILWWGGMGNSTEHTAFLRLKHGMKAPESGSIKTNGKVVAEQIGAQIFIDGWGLILPGEPERAADFARRAASVSHDGEAIYGAQVVAALVSLAFVEKDIQKLLDGAVRVIPKNSIVFRMIADLREWHSAEKDWRKNRERLSEKYGYEKYGGNCHIIPNHGLIILSLLHGEGDFQKSLMIVNTCGWDTDCNSGNVGCILGVRNGLEGIDTGPDWRGPVADRLYLPTADGGRAITDAVSETYRIVSIGRSLASMETLAPKNGARFHFSLPGSVQGFQMEESPESKGTGTLSNEPLEPGGGTRALFLRYRKLAPGRVARFSSATFIPPDSLHMPGYGLIASPTLYPGQTVRAHLGTLNNEQPVTVKLYLTYYDRSDKLVRLYGPEAVLSARQKHTFAWRVPDLHGLPIAQIGFEVSGENVSEGALYLAWLTWEGAPETTFRRHESGNAWRRAWVNGMSRLEGWGDTYQLIQDEGTGLIIQGTREWTDYAAEASITPHMVRSCGIAARVQGMQRYYALLLRDGERVSLVKMLEGETVLAEEQIAWESGKSYRLRLQVEDDRVRGWLEDKPLFDVRDTDRPLTGGAIAYVCEEGRMMAGAIQVGAAG